MFELAIRQHKTSLCDQKKTPISAEDRFQVAKEIKFLRQFQHPNILELEEVYIINASGHPLSYTIHLVTKPWAPVSLHHFIQDLDNLDGYSTLCPCFKPQELEPWPAILQQCLSGVAYLHSQQPPVRHKDIKPHNILLYFEPNGAEKPKVRPIIIDFGISKEHVDGATTANTGTYDYKAPEQIRKSSPTLASDVFSLGCCFALIEGVLRSWPSLRRVHDAATQTDSCQFANNIHYINKVLDSHELGIDNLRTSALSFYCKRLRKLVCQMLEQDPDDRLSAALALAQFGHIGHDLARFLDAPILEVCIDLKKWKKHKIVLVEINLGKLKDDKGLIRELHRRYTDAAGHHRGIFEYLHTITAVKYVRFIIRHPDNQIAYIEDDSVMPPGFKDHASACCVLLNMFKNLEDDREKTGASSQS